MPTEENEVGHKALDDEVPPPLIVEGEIDPNKSDELLNLENNSNNNEGTVIISSACMCCACPSCI